MVSRNHSGHWLSQWETTLYHNVVCHWLGSDTQNDFCGLSQYSDCFCINPGKGPSPRLATQTSPRDCMHMSRRHWSLLSQGSQGGNRQHRTITLQRIAHLIYIYIYIYIHVYVYVYIQIQTVFHNFNLDDNELKHEIYYWIYCNWTQVSMNWDRGWLALMLILMIIRSKNTTLTNKSIARHTAHTTVWWPTVKSLI